MLTLIKSCQRGHADHGWLKSQHSFSFADYHDPARMGFGALRVINEDRIAPGTGFGTHGHRDMEIISYVLAGELAHADSIGNGQAGGQGGGSSGVIRPGDVQRMSAGSGVRHSEFNHAQGQQTHFLQIWIQPNRLGVPPRYAQRHYPEAAKRGRLCLIVAGEAPESSDAADAADAKEGSAPLSLHADARLYAGLFDGAETAELALAPGRQAYAHLVRGTLTVNGQRLNAGDALELRQEAAVRIEAGADAELLLFDLAG